MKARYFSSPNFLRFTKSPLSPLSHSQTLATTKVALNLILTRNTYPLSHTTTATTVAHHSSHNQASNRLIELGVDIDADTGINLVNTHFDADTDMFGVHDLVGDEVVVEREVVVKAANTIPVSAATTTTTVITDDEITLAKALTELRSAKLPT
ncbi:hypothetical protein Tco_1455129, partial [Tanacetum coccineum]